MNNQTQRRRWEKLYDRKPVSEQDYREICDNLWGFFSVLHEWNEAERKSNENERSSDNRGRYISDTP